MYKKWSSPKKNSTVHSHQKVFERFVLGPCHLRPPPRGAVLQLMAPGKRTKSFSVTCKVLSVVVPAPRGGHHTTQIKLFLQDFVFLGTPCGAPAGVVLPEPPGTHLNEFLGVPGVLPRAKRWAGPPSHNTCWCCPGRPLTGPWHGCRASLPTSSRDGSPPVLGLVAHFMSVC